MIPASTRYGHSNLRSAPALQCDTRRLWPLRESLVEAGMIVAGSAQRDALAGMPGWHLTGRLQGHVQTSCSPLPVIHVGCPLPVMLGARSL